MPELDRPERIGHLRARIRGKPFLRSLYCEFYERYSRCLARCPEKGAAVELGSGAGFVREILPEVLTSDVIPYPGIDHVVDAMRMPFSDGSLRALFLLNVFHHISDPGAFLAEVQRCLAPGGRMLLIDQHPGWISKPIYQHLHHEPFHPDATTWEFETTGPLSGANGALAWVVFQRDLARFHRRFPELVVERYEPHTPLRYWLAGGLKSWTLVPGWSFRFVSAVDRALIRVGPGLGSFVDVEIVKRGKASP